MINSRVKRIVVFTGDLSYSVRKGIVEINRALPGLSWLIIVHQPKKSASQLLRSQWINFRKNGWRWIPYQAVDVLRRLIAGRDKPAENDMPGGGYSRNAIESAPNIAKMAVTDIHSPEALTQIEVFSPDLGLSLAAPILRRPLFGMPKLGTLNLHKGKVPDYRGMPPAFWELWNDERSIGCTVHYVEDKLDAGDVAQEGSVARSRFSTVRGLQLQLDELGVRLMRDAVVGLSGGEPVRTPQSSAGRTFRKPTLAQSLELDRRLMKEQNFPKSHVIQTIKQVRTALNLACWQAGIGRLIKRRITVLLYHRVSDDARDNLTVGIEQFDRQMRLLRRYCVPLSIQQVVSASTIPASARPLVAVTFDDGYLDNFENAAPILQRHGVPAAFFVSTGLIGTDRRFPHDVRRSNPQIPLMNWDQVRQMHAMGFTIGSHSVSHIDCASEAEDVVRAELERSRDDLVRELGIAEFLFGYPYGGQQHMTEERLELVKQAGYAGCLAAYGGRNIGHVDRYNVLRRGIHWEFSDAAFLWECLGLF